MTNIALNHHGIFIISLDLEMQWGVRDKPGNEDYQENLLGARQIIPELLRLFTAQRIHATWAIVGMLFCRTRAELFSYFPDMRPCYANTRLDPYRDLDCLGADEAHDPLHYAPSLVQRINATAGQEIASHTFSHYYCLEQGQTVETFREDLRAARRVAADQRISLSSLVLPRNQLNAAYLGVCKELGFRCYRGHANSWVYAPRREHDESLPYRGMRLIDSYLNLTGHHCYPISLQDDNLPINLPASRFLRPYPACVQLFEMLRLQRILADLTWAAEHRQVYHLWWHPHNFGKRQAQNLAFLRVILRHFTTLRDQFGMESATMGETAALLLERANPCTKCSTAPYRAPQDVY